jgi:4-hydroxy-3-methylbut-2-enyl diphosphate reductase
MEIIRAREMGFCLGVRRAVEMMEEAVARRGPMASLGATVHNRQVVERLRQQGVEVINTIEEANGRLIAITAHGVGAEVMEELGRRGIPVIDTTCPIVSRSQQWARRLVEEGFGVVVFGDPEHKEVLGVLGWTRGKGVAIPDEAGLDSLPEEMPSRIAVLSRRPDDRDRGARQRQHPSPGRRGPAGRGSNISRGVGGGDPARMAGRAPAGRRDRGHLHPGLRGGRGGGTA